MPYVGTHGYGALHRFSSHFSYNIPSNAMKSTTAIRINVLSILVLSQ